MTTIYCPFKMCNWNNANKPSDEGICTIDELLMNTADYDNRKFPYCPNCEER